MLKYDSEEMRLTCAGTGGEILADLAACTMRVVYNICGKSKSDTRAMLLRYVASLLASAGSDEAWELLEAEEKHSQSMTVDLRHLMNGMKRGEEGEQ